MDTNPRSGLRAFAFHAGEWQETAAGLAAAAAGRAGSPYKDLSPEAAARLYLDAALGSQADGVQAFTAGQARGRSPEFQLVGVEKIPLTETLTVKFRQRYRGIPVYGSFVTVELEDDNQLLSVDSALAEPDVDPVAEFSVKQVIDIIRKEAGYPDEESLDIAPKLHYYHAPEYGGWCLVYVAEDVPKYRTKEQIKEHGLPEVNDYIICAHTGRRVGELPRAFVNELAGGGQAPTPPATQPRGLAAPPAVGPVDSVAPAAVTSGVTATDEPPFPEGWEVLAEPFEGYEQTWNVRVMRRGKRIRFYDPVLRVSTHDFRFADINFKQGDLPGAVAEVPLPPPDQEWVEGALHAHANAAAVMAFLRDVLHRNGLDNLGAKLVSSVRCCSALGGGNARAWHNAAWWRGQMVYGQRWVEKELRSYARAAEVVVHEITHGLTERTARLQYVDETGALNESYSDIFGVLVTNYGKTDRNDAGAAPAGSGQWDWELGKGLGQNGGTLRSMADPHRGDPPQPKHMEKYYVTSEDHGGVHANSGIHNHAFFKLAVTRGPDNKYLFADRDLAVLFYLALTQHLSHRSGFRDSRRAVELVARTYYRRQPDPRLYVDAVAAAFDAVGIKA